MTEVPGIVLGVPSGGQQRASEQQYDQKRPPDRHSASYTGTSRPPQAIRRCWGEGPQPLQDGLARLPLRGVLAEVEDDPVRCGAALRAGGDEGAGELVGDEGPFPGIRRDAEPDPAPEALALAVERHHDDAVVGVEAEQVRERVGQFGRGAQRDVGFRRRSPGGGRQGRGAG
ncbi:hypothetical protein GCM10020221_33970 [Streptomyces thioluteus]|uniref:Uncharacterized protein n=1 Tax=Streptomyces thioluteus TaxID=66431 RepID=A0ABN3X5H9_STRTU